jgi:hypothetical protein
MDHLSYDDCRAKAADAWRKSALMIDAAARDEYVRIAAIWEDLAASMKRHGLSGAPLS